MLGPLWGVQAKGQLISKCLFGVFNFFQKMNKNKSTWGIIVVKSNSFIHFLEETSAWKNNFDFVWPLAEVDIQKGSSKLFLWENYFRNLALHLKKEIFYLLYMSRSGVHSLDGWTLTLSTPPNSETFHLRLESFQFCDIKAVLVMIIHGR